MSPFSADGPSPRPTDASTAGNNADTTSGSTDELYAEINGTFPFDPSLVNVTYPPIRHEGRKYHISSLDEYKEMHRRSLEDPEGFWGDMAKKELRWIHPFSRVSEGDFTAADYMWFVGGKINACENCVDRWAEERPNDIAIIAEGDDPTKVTTVTYRELRHNVCRFANVLIDKGVRKGDVVTLYMPSIPELAYAMLACARIGAIHSVVFGGYSAASIAERIRDADSHIIITVDESYRGGKTIKMKSIVDEALLSCAGVTTCLVLRYAGVKVNMKEGRDFWLDDLLEHVRPYCPIEVMDSEDSLFLLYTSGSTGRPKGVSHTTGGYLVYAHATTKYIFDAHVGDIFGCVADLGWITGHTYVVYGPLLNGLTTFMFSSLPNYPDPGRYWRMIEQHRITQFYTAPTAIRSLMRHGDDYPRQYDISSVRVLGSVGEPINPEAWRWYYEVVGRGRTNVVDTYWQTENGGIVVAPLAGVTPMKPGSATLPFFGIDVALVDSATGKEILQNDVGGLLVVRRPWPGIFRTLYNSHKRGIVTYFSKVPGSYLTGDAAYRDKDGYIWINGRVDDTLNISGHRIGSADIEHALVEVSYVAEAAAVAFPHPIKGNGIFCFVSLKDGFDIVHDVLERELKLAVRRIVGPFATPDIIISSPNLPKTRSGKIMRRILRKLVSGQAKDLGDTSTLADQTVLEGLTVLCHDVLERFNKHIH